MIRDMCLRIEGVKRKKRAGYICQSMHSGALKCLIDFLVASSTPNPLGYKSATQHILTRILSKTEMKQNMFASAVIDIYIYITRVDPVFHEQ